jgi:hypothetical protein
MGPEVVQFLIPSQYKLQLPVNLRTAHQKAQSARHALLTGRKPSRLLSSPVPVFSAVLEINRAVLIQVLLNQNDDARINRLTQMGQCRDAHYPNQSMYHQNLHWQIQSRFGDRLIPEYRWLKTTVYTPACHQ